MKKLLLLLLISIGLSGCGRDYKDIVDDIEDEYCKLFSFSKESYSSSKLDELWVEWRNEIESIDPSSSKYRAAAKYLDSINCGWSNEKWKTLPQNQKALTTYGNK